MRLQDIDKEKQVQQLEYHQLKEEHARVTEEKLLCEKRVTEGATER